MEYFSRVLYGVNGEGIAFHPKSKKSGIMELMFVDDLLVFTKPETPSLLKLRQVIEDFAKVSGLHINNNKSVIYIAGVSPYAEASILTSIGVLKGDLPFRYLGFPLSAKRLSIQDCLPIVDKITARIKHGAGRNLSMAGRVKLVNSVVQSMHTYWS